MKGKADLATAACQLRKGLSPWQLISKHGCEADIVKEACRGPMIEDASEQTRGRETEPTARDKGRKDKSCDTIANMEARLAKVELAMANTQEGLDLIEQGMEKGMKDLREQI